MNLLKNSKPQHTGNYWCTWRTQTTVSKNKTLQKINTDSNRDCMGEEFLFGEVGVLHTIDPEIRGDLIVVLDDGWDIPYGLNNISFRNRDANYFKFGSLILDETRFPSFTGTPQEKLKKLGDTVKGMGYKGIGLWVAVQVANPECKIFSAEEAEPYWKERMLWCKEADIQYLKLDWGANDHDKDYRVMLNRLAKLYSPSTKIEHAYTQWVFDKRVAEHADEDYQNRLEEIGFYQLHCDYFRVYDATAEFRNVTLMSRAMECFKAARGKEKESNSIPNVEDGVYIGAALGCSIGAMRNYTFESNPAFHYTKKLETPMTALKRALIWQRLAPPFAISESPFEISENYVTDAYCYPYIEGNPWPYVSEKYVAQDCFTAMSRNMPLPEVKAEYNEKPPVVCSIHPLTKALSVYAAPRTTGGSIFYSILADVSVQGGESRYPVGIFGKYKSLTITFTDDITDKKIFAQDLCTIEAQDITEKVAVCGNRLTISGELIETVGLTVRQCKTELPGLIVSILDE
ncbi:MAG: hypothetical protein IJE10_04840 [Clostridia bacterium]|nr:hypothetical protein [Clostridia bacterium]